MKKVLPWISLAAFLLGLCVLCAYSGQIAHEITIWRTKRNLDDAQERLDQVKMDIPIDDTLLVDIVSELYVPDSHPRCVWSSGALIFGSNLSYDEVRNQYREKLKEMDWVYLGEGTNGTRVNYRNDADTVSISIYPDTEKVFRQRIELAEVTETTLDQWKEQFLTIYGIGIMYAEPAILDCYF